MAGCLEAKLGGRLHQPALVGALLRQPGVEFLGQPRLGEGEVDLPQRGHGGPDRPGLRADRVAEAAQHALDLVGLVGAGLPPGVAEVDGVQRLHEDGGAAGGEIVHDAAQLPARFRLDRDHVAAITFSDDRLLRDALPHGAGEGALQPLQQPIVRLTHGAPEPAQGWAGAVKHLAPRADRAFDGLDQRAEVGDASGDTRERGDLRGERGEVLADVVRAAEARGDSLDLRGQQLPAPGRALDERRHILHAAQAELRLQPAEGAGLRGDLLAAANLVEIGTGSEGADPLAPGLEGAEARQAVEDLVELKIRQRLGVQRFPLCLASADSAKRSTAKR